MTVQSSSLPRAILLSHPGRIPHAITRSSGLARVSRRLASGLILLAAGAVLIIGTSARTAKGEGPAGFGPVEHEVKSDYSHIRVRRKGDVRTMVFVRDNGQEAGETMLDLKNPHQLLIPYTRAMFAGYLFRPRPEKVLIVGLGGGAMVQFLKHHQPELQVHAIDIDPEVIRIADEYFGTKPTDNIRITAVDGFEYLKETDNRYDVVFMDAFLKPSSDTDGTGVPLRLKTIKFLKQVQSKLTDGGVVVFNINPGKTLRRDVGTIRKAFPQSYEFRVFGSKNLVVVGSTSETRQTGTHLDSVASELDERFDVTFSFAELLKRLTR